MVMVVEYVLDMASFRLENNIIYKNYASTSRWWS